MNLLEIIKYAINSNASDIHITVASPPIMRVDGQLIEIGQKKLFQEDTRIIVEQILTSKQLAQYDKDGAIDLSYSIKGIGRFRLNVYKQRGSSALALRIVTLVPPTIDELGLPKVIKNLCTKRRGLVLVTGPTGSGKSTTLAAMINEMNHTRNEHIITIEDPIEYLHKHDRCLINQIEIGNDIDSFSGALRNSLRQDPDVILVGEMRDLDTISTAITAAETGHLVLSTVHTIGAANTIDRIVDVFPPHQQQQIKIQLSSVLQGVISQQIMPKASQPGRIAGFEIMLANNAIRNLIREGKTHQIQTVIQTNAQLGMQTMDSSLLKLFKLGKISKDTLLKYAVDKDNIRRRMSY